MLQTDVKLLVSKSHTPAQIIISKKKEKKFVIILLQDFEWEKNIMSII